MHHNAFNDTMISILKKGIDTNTYLLETMSRYFNHKEIELLAPAGNYEIFKELVTTDCDAIYFGGKNFNMRLHRKNYNFSNEELKLAIELAHEHNKKAYITVNNMYNLEEAEDIKEFLIYLNHIQPDAIIVQDLAIIQLIKELNLDLMIHSSVMMNVHNLAMIQQLEQLGVTRVVLSRETTLEYSKYLSSVSPMEFEYFIHGDMCVAHGSQCIYSGILYGQSSNRGKCLKPCRWGYEVVQGDSTIPHHYPLAVKDMSMYEHLPELIHGGITSFKIEGRMRDVEYLKLLIASYSDSINRYIEDPLSYDRQKDSKLLYENRKRDTSTGYAFGTPGRSNINERYEGTGTLFSTGKVFSVATEERSTTDDIIHKTKLALMPSNVSFTPKLTVKVNNYEQALYAISKQVEEIYLSGDVFLDGTAFTKEQLLSLTSNKGNSKVYLCLPHMTFDKQLEEYRHILSSFSGLDGIMTTNLGSFHALKHIPLPQIGDYSLNILNDKSAALYQSLGLKRFTISLEGNITEVNQLLHKKGEHAELIVHGSPTVMYMEHDLYDYVSDNTSNQLYLKDEAGFKHPVNKDIHGRNHLLLYKELCYLPILKELHAAGLHYFRLEIPHLDFKTFQHVIDTYQEALSDLQQCEKLYKNHFTCKDYSFGAFHF